jgi:hypothetical protein
MGHAVLTPFHTPLGEILIKPLYVQFYENGNLQSMAMCPDCSIELSTPFGDMLVRKGFSFDPQGHLNSFEPHEPVEVQTPNRLNMETMTKMVIDVFMLLSPKNVPMSRLHESWTLREFS